VRYLVRSWTGWLGLVLVGLMVLAAVVSLMWTPYDPTDVVPSQRWKAMSWAHPFGTDGGGKDLLSQVLVGARTTLLVTLTSAALSTLIGLVLGIASAILPRYVGESLAYLIDVLIALPTLILALVFVAALGGSVWTISLAIGVGSGVILARVVKAETARVLTQDYVVAAAASGSSTWRSIWRHVIPNIASTVVVQVSLIAALAVLAEAALSYLGLTPVSTPSWGRMLSELQRTVTVHPAALIFPGLAVIGATLGFNLLGDALRDAIDPRLRSRAGAVTPEIAARIDRVEAIAAAPVTAAPGEVAT
jgi:peptide/nickel transport system permease protein